MKLKPLLSPAALVPLAVLAALTDMDKTTKNVCGPADNKFKFAM